MRAAPRGLPSGSGSPIIAGPGAGRSVPYGVRELADGDAIAAATCRCGSSRRRVRDRTTSRTSSAMATGRLTGDLDGIRGARSILRPGRRRSPGPRHRARLRRAGTERALARRATRERLTAGLGPVHRGATPPGSAGGSGPRRPARAGAYGPGIRKHGRPASATPWSWPHGSSSWRPAAISAARL